MGYTPWWFAAGVVLGHAVRSFPPFPIGALLPAFACLAWRRTRWLGWVLLGLCYVWSVATARIESRLPHELESVDLDLVGVVSSDIEERGAARRFEFVIDAPERLVGRRVRLAWYTPPVGAPQPGETWRLRARLRAPRGFANPGGFDYERWLFVRRIDATGYVRDATHNQRLSEAELRLPLLRARLALAGTLETALGGHDRSGIVIALAVGLREQMDARDWETLRATGTSHLVAISGLHIGMVAALAAWLTRRVWGRSQRMLSRLSCVDAAALAAALAAIAYAALAGFSLPTRRALVMLGVVLLARSRRRMVASTHGLGLALLAVLLLDPLAPLSAGFWLSFGAVAALLYTLDPGSARRGGRVRRALRAQFGVSIGLLPITAGHFGTLSLIAPLVNLALIPLFALVVVPCVLVGCMLLALIPAAGNFCLAVAAHTLGLVWPLLEEAAAVPWALYETGERPIWQLALAVVGAACALAARRVRWRTVGVVLLVPLFLPAPGRIPVGGFELAVLDVGQGLASVVRTARHTLVYDAGPRFRSGSDTGSMVVVPFLRSRGAHPHMMLVSHADQDHSGGADSVINAFSAISLRGAHPGARPCRAGQQWEWDEVSFTMLHPARPYRSRNNGSCVLRIDSPGGSALLTGDIEADAERDLLSRGASLRADIVVAPHHGSKTSSSPEFVRATGARLVVFAAGYRNRWGQPAEEVLERWRARGAQPLVTADSGAVLVRVLPHEGVADVIEWRLARRRYWHARDPQRQMQYDASASRQH